MGPQKSRQMLAASSATLENVQIEWRCRKYYGLNEETFFRSTQTTPRRLAHQAWANQKPQTPGSWLNTNVAAESQSFNSISCQAGWKQFESICLCWVQYCTVHSGKCVYLIYQCGAAFSNPLILPLPLPSLGYFNTKMIWDGLNDYFISNEHQWPPVWAC